MKLPMVLVAFGQVLLLGFIVSCAEALGEAFQNEGKLQPSRSLSSTVPSEGPPDYGLPTYDYGYPPPYQYETSSSVTSVPPNSVSSTLSTAVDSVVTTSTVVVTVTGQSSSTSDKYITSTETQTLTHSDTTEQTAGSTSTKPDPWVSSSVLGVTGTSTSSTSTEQEESSSPRTTTTYSESATNTGLSSSQASSSTTTWKSDNTDTITPSLSTDVTSTRLATATITKEVTVTSSTHSSVESFESSELPITASLSSTKSKSPTSNAPSSFTTITHTVKTLKSTGASDSVTFSHSSSEWSSSTWSSVLGGTQFPSVSTVINTVTVSSGILVTIITESLSSVGTSTVGSDTRSYSVSSSHVGSSTISSTGIDGTPRTNTYFSSTWANNTMGSSTIVSSPASSQESSLPSSISTRLGTISTGTTVRTVTVSPSVTLTHQTQTITLTSGVSGGSSTWTISTPPFTMPSNSTASVWSSSSARGTVILPSKSQQSIKTSAQPSPLTSIAITLGSSLPPFPNITASSTNISNHSPWTSKMSETRTVTSIVWTSLPPHSSEHNSTNNNLSPTASSGFTTTRTRFTYHPTSVVMSTWLSSGVTTKTLPPFPIPSNTTDHQQTKTNTTVSSTLYSVSSGYASSSESHRFSSTATRNATYITTLTERLSSTIRLSPNSTTALSQKPQSSGVLVTTMTGPGSNSTSGFTATSGTPSLSTTSLETSRRSSYASSPRWTNSSIGFPTPKSSDSAGGTTFTRTIITTWSTSPSASETHDVNSSTGALSSDTFASSRTWTISPSEITLWPTNITSSTGTESRGPEITSTARSTIQPSNGTKTGIETTATYPGHTTVEVTTITLAPICTDTSVNGSSSTGSRSISTACSTFLNGTVTMTRCLALPPSNDPGAKSLSNILSSRNTFPDFRLSFTANRYLDPFPAPTTFSTSVRNSGGSSGDSFSSLRGPTNKVGLQPETSLPNNPNYPWGGDSPVHRHQSVGQLGAGVAEGGLLRRWASDAIRKVRTLLS
ncbi:hypothetical protein VFPPC_04702 [Pochonia chlamydosporia 170]|uniref:Uncharacterized protein n=1 Tax=Pochonia chlamydosporia 170 TaxID=1380566 RepID=A0A179FTX6_METCM|nr:hypothetical protein VFPPC_04702 [Pochonia chlamydosporia 170]OAQ68469.1 hypothetical protein VFPPC_04702 [Pochonia chlamydosporia 170]